jgi:hypothetical protein
MPSELDILAAAKASWDFFMVRRREELKDHEKPPQLPWDSEHLPDRLKETHLRVVRSVIEENFDVEKGIAASTNGKCTSADAWDSSSTRDYRRQLGDYIKRCFTEWGVTA